MSSHPNGEKRGREDSKPETNDRKRTKAETTQNEAKSKLNSDKRAKLLEALQRSKTLSNPTSKPTSKTSNKSTPQKSLKLSHKLSKPSLKPPTKSIPSSANQLTDLQSKMKKTLSGGRFRMINEKLYTTTSDVAVNLFKEEPETFDIYHEGFRAQVELWPSNPVDHFITTLGAYKQTKTQKESGPLVIADMGCGEAALAKSLMSQNVAGKPPKFKVHSFDLASPNEYVVACDIRQVPLDGSTVDVCVFSLSLMGTNFLEFLEEAWRILKVGGQLRIAEVVSRFPDIDKFVTALTGIGFKLMKKDASNKMFILFDFVKVEKSGSETAAIGKKNKKAKSETEHRDSAPLLTPCLYRKR